MTACRTLSLALLLATTPMAVWAQDSASFPPGTLTLQRDPNDPSTLLNRYLRMLSTDPRNLEALLGAGRAALAMGDANAAIGFFGRAEAVAPTNGRVKAGLAASAVQQEQPRQALRLFDQAVAAGVPVAEIGGDRGLAYDLRGDNRLAQADYRAALAVRKDDEITRRLALSTAIGGDRAGAMRILDPLLRRQDKAAWRAATFVLAMTGDTPGAVKRANQLMIPTQAAAMTPYLLRLAGLDAAAKAAAVHFGRFPALARPAGTQLAAVTPTARGVGQMLTPTGVARGQRPNAARPGGVTAAPGAAGTVANTVPMVVPSRTLIAVNGGGTTAGRIAVIPPTAGSVTSVGMAAAGAVSALPGGAMLSPAPTSTTVVRPTIEGVGSAAPTGGVSNAASRDLVMAAAGAAPVPAMAARFAGPVIGASGAGSSETGVAAGPARVPARDGVSPGGDAVRGGVSTAPAARVAPASAATVLPTMGPAVDVVRMTTAGAAGGTAAVPITTTAARIRVVHIAPVAPAAVAAPIPPRPGTGKSVMLTSAEKALLAIRTRGDVATLSLTRAQRARLTAAANNAAMPAPAKTLTADEKHVLGIRTKGDVAIAGLTRAQKAKLAVAGADATVLTAAQKAQLGMRAKGDVAVATLTRAQKAKLAAMESDGDLDGATPAPVLTAAEKSTLGIRRAGDVTVASLTRAQKAKLAAAGKPADGGQVLTAAEKAVLGIRTRGDVAVAGLTRLQKKKLASAGTLDGEDADTAVLTAAEKTTLGIRTKGDVTVAGLTRAQRSRLAAADKGGRDGRDGSAKAGKATPERYWVQVAGGANKATLPKAFAGIRAKNGALLNGRGAWTTPLRATNRLLVGPFGSAGEAQAFVNKAGGAGLNAFTYTSPAGQAVEKLPLR